jgi:hypothetical protein
VVFADLFVREAAGTTTDKQSRTSRHSESISHDCERLGQFTEDDCFKIHACLHKLFDIDEILSLDKNLIPTVADVPHTGNAARFFVQQMDSATKYLAETSLPSLQIEVRAIHFSAYGQFD